jgi:hypothetical protein
MSTKRFRYPPIFKIVKIQIKVMMVLAPLLLIGLLRSNYSLSREEYRIAILSIPFTILLCMLIIGSICEIKTDTNGLYIEFFWKYLFVPWEDIRGIKYVGFRPVGYWIVITNNSLTLFHRLYAVGTLPLLPSFHIHENIESRSVLLSIIESKFSQNINKRDLSILK